MRRRFKKALLRLALLLAAIALCCLWGWRYGFTSLPAPVSESGEFAKPVPRWEDLGDSNCWYWIREFGSARLYPRSRGRQPGGGGLRLDELMPAIEAWGRSGAPFSERAQAARQWIEDQPELGRHFEQVIGAPDRRLPTGPAPWKRANGLILGVYPMARAVGAEARGEIVEALDSMTEAWAFQACLVPVSQNAELFNERGVEQLDTWLVQPWRRLALGPAPIPTEAGTRLLARLDEVAQTLPSAETVYREMLGRVLTAPGRAERADWHRVRSAYRIAVLRLRQESSWLMAGGIERIFGGRRPAEVRIVGARHLLRPLSEGLMACQAAVARPADRRRVRDAWLHAALAVARDHRPPGLTTTPEPHLPAGAGWTRRWLDRPAAWRAADGLPRPEPIRAELSAWWLYLAECRLTLALRLYRDRHGDWPGRLDDLVPEFLPGVPANPFGPVELSYERQKDTWRLRRTGHRPPGAKT